MLGPAPMCTVCLAQCGLHCLSDNCWMLCCFGVQVDKAGLLTAMRNVANPPMELDALEVRWPCCCAA